MAESNWAGRGARLSAVIIDNMILLGIWSMLIFSVAKAVLYSEMCAKIYGDIFAEYTDATEFPITQRITTAVVLLIVWAVVNGYFLHKRGQTIGKLLLGIKIVRSDGKRAGLLRILLLRRMPFNAMILANTVGGVVKIFDALSIFRRDQRCIHDMLASTVVVKVKRKLDTNTVP